MYNGVVDYSSVFQQAPDQTVVRKGTGYTPRPFQQYLHSALKRFNVLVCHRRFGKTVFTINEMIDRGMTCGKKNPQYAYIAPTYRQAKVIAWEYLIEFTKNLPGVEVNKSELTVYIHRKHRIDKDENGNDKAIYEDDKIIFRLLGGDNPDSLRGLYLDGAILDEYAQCDPIIWGQIVRPALADRKGWAIFIGTPKGQNHFFRRYTKALEQPDSWFVAKFKASETGILDQDEIAEMMADMEEDEIEQELECSFTAAILGSYFGHLMNDAKKEDRITTLAYNPSYPVDTFWDLGIGDSLAIWFRQKIGPVYYYIDYLEMNGKGLDYYANELRKRGYNYGRHILPHDGRARDLGTGLTRQETLRNLGFICEIQKKVAIDDRIMATRTRIRQSYFDAEKCARGIEALFNYQKEWDTKAQDFKTKPKHDWASHGASSFGYSALDDKDSLLIARAQRFSNNYNHLRETAVSDYNEFDF
jgi:hypothetical protein